MFLRSIAYMPVQSTIFRANTLQNVGIKRGIAAERGNTDNVCKEPCPGHSPTCTDKIKEIQSRFQHIWREKHCHKCKSMNC
nr:uncharacterized protein LOC106686095 isoform X2 [Halyomorpha halys]